MSRYNSKITGDHYILPICEVTEVANYNGALKEIKRVIVEYNFFGTTKMKRLFTSLTLSNLSSVALIFSMIFLGLEVRLTRKAAEIDAISARAEVIDQSTRQLALSTELLEAYLKYEGQGLEKLSPIEVKRISNWERARMERMQSQFYQWSQNMYPQEYVKEMISAVNAAHMKTWEDFGIMQFIANEDFLQAINIVNEKN